MKKSELKKEIRERILEKKCKTADIDEMSTSGGAGAYNTPYAFKLKKKDKDLDEVNNLQEVDEDRYVRAAFEDLEQVIRNLAHTTNISEDEAIEMTIKKLEAMLDGRDDMEESLDERVVSDNESPMLKAKIAAEDFMYEFRKEFRIVSGNFGKEAGEEFKNLVKAKIAGLKENLSNVNEVSDIKMGHLATNDDGVKKPIYLNYGYKLVDKSKS